MTDPKNKGDKDAGLLSETAKAELVKIYNLEKYGRKYEVITKVMDKGIQAEQDSINLLSLVDNRKYVKNELQLENEFIKGTPDIIYSEDGWINKYIFDTKTSWSLDTFQQNRYKRVDKDYYYQLLGYMCLTGSIRGEICYCLTNTPDSILNGEMYKLLSRMDVVTEEDPRYKIAAEMLLKCHNFDDIPIIERVIRIKYDYNQVDVTNVYEKVKKCREWLMEFDKSPRII